MRPVEKWKLLGRPKPKRWGAEFKQAGKRRANASRPVSLIRNKATGQLNPFEAWLRGWPREWQAFDRPAFRSRLGGRHA